jgi:hypothetical protein
MIKIQGKSGGGNNNMIITTDSIISGVVADAQDREIITWMRYNFGIKNSLFRCYPRTFNSIRFHFKRLFTQHQLQ